MGPSSARFRRQGRLGIRMRAFLALLGLFVCASSMAQASRAVLDESKAALQAAPSCCKSSLEFPAEKAAFPLEVTLTIDRSGPAFPFPAPLGKSFFRVIELPRFEAEYMLHIETHFYGPASDENERWLFWPLLLYLDENRRPLGL